MSGMREAYVHGRAEDPDAPPRKVAQRAVVTGFSGAARVVTAAALIMFFVFASFVPEGSSVIKPIALGLAVGIAADAFLVRMTLVPAVMALPGGPPGICRSGSTASCRTSTSRAPGCAPISRMSPGPASAPRPGRRSASTAW